jgi:hypothetical protein
MSLLDKLVDLRNLPSKAKEVAKGTYVDLGHKLLVRVLSPINRFARHIIELQGKDPNYVKPPEPTLKEAMPVRPSFRFNESKGWTQGHLKTPAQNHPILVMRAKLASEGGLRDKAAEELAAKAAAAVAQEDVLQRTLPTPDPIDDLRKAVSELKFDAGQADILMDDIEVEMTSGSRAVSKAKVAAKKVKSSPKKKAVRVKKTKKGTFHRVED